MDKNRVNQREQIQCNRCGRILDTEGTVREEYVQVEKQWGYFSNGKDGLRHRFCLCETCYDEITGQFVLPIEEQEILEW